MEVGGRELAAIECDAASRGRRTCMEADAAAKHAFEHGLVKALNATPG